jgi:hypothetical protein
MLEEEDIMEQTESYTTIYHKHAGQPKFTLIAQDATADLVVDFWVEIQLQVKQFMEDGLSLELAIEKIRQQFGVPPWSQFTTLHDPKLKGAAEIGYQMSEWRNRKVAD